MPLSDGPVGTQLLDKLPDHGVIGLGIWDLGFRQHHEQQAPDRQGRRHAGP